MINIEITGISELLARWKAGETRLREGLENGMKEALKVVQERIPPYPPQPPPKGKPYIRTGNLARGFGSGMEGGAIGTPTIFEVELGGSFVEGKIGANTPYYNEYVVGENQASHMGHWWIFKTEAMKAMSVVTAVFQKVVDKWVQWMNG